MAFELQADCYAGTWAKSAYKENRLEDGDVQEALDAALAVGDFDANNPAHHGTPAQREGAWNSGFEAGDPSSCSRYLDPANLGDAGGTPQQVPDAGDPQEQDPGAGGAAPQQDPGAGYPQEQDPGAGGAAPQQDPVPATRRSRTRATRRTTRAPATRRTASLPAAARRRDRPGAAAGRDVRRTARGHRADPARWPHG
jgi:hypothetical protein